MSAPVVTVKVTKPKVGVSVPKVGVNVGVNQPQVVVRPSGPPGPTGPVGPQGPQGPAGVQYVHYQAMPSSLWIVAHNLGKHPTVTAEDAAGSLMFGTVTHRSNDELTIEFAYAINGRANCL